MKRCKWCNLNNPKYVEYHDNEWCKPNYDEKYLYGMPKEENLSNYDMKNCEIIEAEI